MSSSPTVSHTQHSCHWAVLAITVLSASNTLLWDCVVCSDVHSIRAQLKCKLLSETSELPTLHLPKFTYNIPQLPCFS